VPTIQPSSNFREKLKARIELERPRGAASRRLEALSKPRADHRPIRPLYLAISLATAAAVLLMTGLVGFTVLQSQDHPDTIISPGQAQTARLNHYEQRKEALAEREEITIDANLLEVADLVLDEEPDEMVLVAHHIEDTNERCIMAFTPSQWKEHQKLDALEAFEANLRRHQAEIAVTVPVRNGQVVLTDPMLAAVNGSKNLSVLKLDGHTEIWSSEILVDYMEEPDLYIRVSTERASLDAAVVRPTV
jgi:hypothetical protein